MLDCTNNNLSLDQILNAILIRDANGNCSINTIPVVDGNDDFKTCLNNNLGNRQLLNQLLGVDINGNLGVRIIQGVASATNCKDCDNQNIPIQDMIANHVIGLAADGYPALRLGAL